MGYVAHSLPIPQNGHAPLRRMGTEALNVFTYLSYSSVHKILTNTHFDIMRYLTGIELCACPSLQLLRQLKQALRHLGSNIGLDLKIFFEAEHVCSPFLCNAPLCGPTSPPRLCYAGMLCYRGFLFCRSIGTAGCDAAPLIFLYFSFCGNFKAILLLAIQLVYCGGFIASLAQPRGLDIFCRAQIRVLLK